MADSAGRDLDVTDALELVRAAWEVDDAFSPQTRRRSLETVSRFTTRASVQGARTVHDLTPAVCAGFCTPTA